MGRLETKEDSAKAFLASQMVQDDTSGWEEEQPQPQQDPRQTLHGPKVIKRVCTDSLNVPKKSQNQKLWEKEDQI